MVLPCKKVIVALTRPMAKGLSVLLISLFCLSILGTTLHKHGNLSDRHSCSFCMLAQDLSQCEDGCQPTIATPQSIDALFIEANSELICAISQFSNHSRAPPANLP